MVPWPSGILAVGDGDAADLPLLERTSEAASEGTGVAGAEVGGSDVGDVVVGDVAATDPAGVTGFMRSPLSRAGAASGDSTRDTGAGGSTFSR